MTSIRAAGVVACVLFAGGCDEVDDYLDRTPSPPTADQVVSHFARHEGIDSVRMSGNVAEIHVEQPFRQLERGGSIWARVGPFVYLMTPSTRTAFEEFPGLAAVRVVTHLPDGDEVARAMLRRDTLSDILWRRTLNILGHALESGRENPRRLEELTEWAEQYADFEYNPDYVDN
ncbi:MAG: hypothetical protein ACOCUW_04125 [Gemmatimonadota bacterium]